MCMRVLLVFMLTFPLIKCDNFDVTCSVIPVISYTKSGDESNENIKSEISLTGVNTIISVIDLKHVSSVHQAIMLTILMEKLNKNNYSQVQLLLINPYEPGPSSKNFHMVVNKIIGDNTYLIQENYPSEIFSDSISTWSNVFVTDRCGRITYRIIPPWSLAQYPYVKSAVLSTFFDKPCGFCLIQYEDSASLNKKFKLLEYDTDSNEMESFWERLYAELKVKINSLTELENESETSEIFNNSSTVFENNGVSNISLSDFSFLNENENTDNTVQIQSENDLNKTKSDSDDIIEYTDSPVLDDFSENTTQSTTIDDLPQSQQISAHTESELDFNSIEKPSGNLPLKIVIPWPHSHIHGNFNYSHKFAVLKMGDPKYHGHIGSPYVTEKNRNPENSTETYMEKKCNSSQTKQLVNIQNFNSNVSNTDRKLAGSQGGNVGSSLDSSLEGLIEERIHHVIPNNFTLQITAYEQGFIEERIHHIIPNNITMYDIDWLIHLIKVIAEEVAADTKKMAVQQEIVNQSDSDAACSDGEETEKKDLFQHYSKLTRWINYKLQ